MGASRSSILSLPAVPACWSRQRADLAVVNAQGKPFEDLPAYSDSKERIFAIRLPMVSEEATAGGLQFFAPPPAIRKMNYTTDHSHRSIFPPG